MNAATGDEETPRPRVGLRMGMVIAHNEPFGAQNYRDVPRSIFRQIPLVVILSPDVLDRDEGPFSFAFRKRGERAVSPTAARRGAHGKTKYRGPSL